MSGWFHVVNLSICQDQHNVVGLLSHPEFGNLNHLLDDRCEVSRSTQTDIGQSLRVKLENALCTKDLWVGVVSIKREAVVNLVNAHKVRYTPKSINWKFLIRIVLFKNGSY